MVRTMRKVRKERKESKRMTPMPCRKDAARLSILRSSSDFTPVNAKPAVNQDVGFGAESEKFSLSQGSQRRENTEESVAKADGSSDDEDEGEGDSEGEGGVDYGDEESDGGDESQELGEAEDRATAAEEEEDDENEDAENEDGNGSSDFEDTTAGKQKETSTKRLSINGKRTVPIWKEPKDTQRLLDLLEQLAMRDYYVNPKRGGWRNNAMGKIGEEMGKDHKQCSNRYFRLKYKYMEVLKLLNLGVGLSWDDETNEVRGSDEAWRRVKDPKLLKLRDHKFLYKEQLDNLNSVLIFVPSPTTKVAEGKAREASNAASVPQSEDGEATIAASINQNDREEEIEVIEDGDNDGTDGNEDDVAHEVETAKLVKPQPNTANSSAAKSSSKKETHDDRKWFDLASMQGLVQLLVKYADDDYYINPIWKTWQNGVFAQIAVRIGKDQRFCQQKWMTLKDTYADIDKLLKSNMGFWWDAEKNEVVGSNEAWAQVKDTNLTRRGRSKFLFKDMFDKLAEKLNFERREHATSKNRKRSRHSARTSGSRSSYVEPSDDIDHSDENGDHGEGDVPEEPGKPPTKKRLFSDTCGQRPPNAEDDHVESDIAEETDEPPRKRRLLSDTYEKRREAFYVAATTFSVKSEELKAMVKIQLAIQRDQVAIHKEQIAALHAQLTMQNKLSQSLEECHLKDSRRRDDLEGWRVTARERLQNEACLTPQGKLTMIKTLRDLRSKAEGYLGVMFLDPILRRLWLKTEFEKLALGELSDYFNEADVGDCNDDLSTGEVVDEDSAFTLVDQDHEFGEDDTLSAKGACENHNSGIGVHFESDGCSSDPVAENHNPNDQELEEQHPVENTEQTDEADSFEIGPYISVKERQDDDIVADTAKKPKEEGADGTSMPVVQELEDGYAVDFNDDSLDDDTLLHDWLNEDAFALSNDDGEFEDAVEYE